MGKMRLAARKKAREFIAGAVACLFLLQALAFVFSTNGRVAFSNGDASASIIMAGEICQANMGDDGKTSAPRHHRHHCTLCAIGNHDQAASASAILARVIAVLAPRSNDAPAWFVHDERAPYPLGWTSSWSWRAPPIFS